MRRIGITCYPTLGGSGVVATELGMELARRGDMVHFISYALPSRLLTLHERIRFHEVNVTHYPLFDQYPPYTLALASKMAEVAEYENLDVLHVHYAIPHAISAYLAKQVIGEKGPKVVTTLHGTDITLVGRDTSYLPITRFGIESSDQVTAVSESLRSDTIRHFEPRKTIEVIPNFVDPERFRKTENSVISHLIEDGSPMLCHISNFRPVKRVLDVLEVFRLVQERMPARLLMVGDGPERSRAEAYCREHHLCDRVIFFGHLPNLENVLGSCDLFLLPSETESFGMAALEAMASEVPVIATRAGGLPEVIPHGEAGYLVEVGNVATMADLALEILGDPERRKQMGRVAREIAIERFSAEKVIPRYVELYDRAIAGEIG